MEFLARFELLGRFLFLAVLEVPFRLDTKVLIRPLLIITEFPDVSPEFVVFRSERPPLTPVIVTVDHQWRHFTLFVGPINFLEVVVVK